jgi:hypothetical protein
VNPLSGVSVSAIDLLSPKPPAGEGTGACTPTDGDVPSAGFSAVLGQIMAPGSLPQAVAAATGTSDERSGDDADLDDDAALDDSLGATVPADLPAEGLATAASLNVDAAAALLTDALVNGAGPGDTTDVAAGGRVAGAEDDKSSPAAGRTDPSRSGRVRHGLDVLDPQFRDRLERVISRMETEYGYKVEVLETYRSQERQNQLYKQGRTEPGPVVTWTRDSNHTAGRAADLLIDGTFANTAAYQVLMRVAQEEGLRTLGARDPGHVELPAPSSAAPATSNVPVAADWATRNMDVSRPAVIARTSPAIVARAAAPAPAPALASMPNESEAPAARPANQRAERGPEQKATATPLRSGGVATVAQVASVARVASPPAVAQVGQVARVARVARVATVGDVAPVPPAIQLPAAPKPAPTQSMAATPVPGTGTPATPSPAASLAASATPSRAPLGVITDAVDEAASDAKSEAGAKRRDRDSTVTEGEASAARTTLETDATRAVTATERTRGANAATGSLVRDGQVAHADASERIARLLKLQDDAADRPMSHVLLRLDGPDGVDRIRIDLRGGSVGTSMDINDGAAAERLTAHLGELQQALQQHGLEADTMTVRTTARSTDATALSRVAAAAVESELMRPNASNASNGGGFTGRERGGARSDDPGSKPDSHRQRPRRGQQGDR